MFNLSHGMFMALESHTNGRSRKNPICFIATKMNTLIATLKADDEIKNRRRIFIFKKLWSMCNISCELNSFYFAFCYCSKFRYYFVSVIVLFVTLGCQSLQ